MSEQRVRVSLAYKPHSVKQNLLMNAFFIPGLLEMCIACGTKFGKALHIDTPIPTPKGWRVMGDLRKGDLVFDENGKSTRIKSATRVMYDRDCYEVIFSDGQRIIADAEHLWETTTHADRKNIARAASPNDRCKTTQAAPKVRTTLEIRDSLTVKISGKDRPNHSINCVSAPLSTSKKDLPIDPYVLGVWLGDGHTASGLITTADHQLLENMQALGREVAKKKSKYAWRVFGLTSELSAIHLIGSKHVPEIYLDGSPEQRLALLQGLMDTDGTVSKRGDCCFDNTNKNLVDAVEALAISLGIKVNRASRIPKLNGVEHKICYRAWFTTDLKVFRLDRKLIRLRAIASKAKTRYIVAVNPVPSVPVRCIEVENPSHLYLAGRGCIPTHNSSGAATAMSLAFPLRKQALFRWISPIYSTSRIGWKYAKRMLPPEPHVKANESYLTLSMPYIDSQIQFFHGQNAESIEGEASAGNILDEAAKLKEDVYNSVKTTTTVTRGPIVMLSTPKGKSNWFYKKCMEAKEEMIRAKFEGRRPTKIFIHAPSWTNPAVSMEVVEDARRTMPFRLYQQYYEAVFLSSGEVFTNVQNCFITDYIEANDQFLWTAEGIDKLSVVIGVDWARNVDYTVFIAMDPKTRRVVAYWRMRGLGYPTQIKRLKTYANKFGSVETIWHDKTGVGVALDDMLAETELPYRGITFTNASKNEMMVKLMLAFEQGDIGIPQIEQMINELNDIEVKTTLTGLPTYAASDGSHDDTVMSLALAYSAMLQHSEREYGIIEF